MPCRDLREFLAALGDDLVRVTEAFDPKFEIWVGERAGVEGAKERFGADEAFPVEELEKKLTKERSDSKSLTDRVSALEKIICDLSQGVKICK